MPTTPEEFQQAAEDIKVEFADFFIPRLFTLIGDYSPVGGSANTTEIVDAMREEYAASQVDGGMVQLKDFKLLALVNDFTVINPTADGLKVDVGGVTLQVIRATKDAANAVWTIQVRG